MHSRTYIYIMEIHYLMPFQKSHCLLADLHRGWWALRSIKNEAFVSWGTKQLVKTGFFGMKHPVCLPDVFHGATGVRDYSDLDFALSPETWTSGILRLKVGLHIFQDHPHIAKEEEPWSRTSWFSRVHNTIIYVEAPCTNKTREQNIHQ